MTLCVRSLLLFLLRNLSALFAISLLLGIFLLDDKFLEEVKHDGKDTDENDEQIADLGGRAQVADVNAAKFHTRLLLPGGSLDSLEEEVLHVLDFLVEFGVLLAEEIDDLDLDLPRHGILLVADAIKIVLCHVWRNLIGD